MLTVEFKRMYFAESTKCFFRVSFCCFNNKNLNNRKLFVFNEIKFVRNCILQKKNCI